MTIDIDYYRKISGSYESDTKQDYQKLTIGNQISRNMSGALGYETVLLNGVSKDVIIQNKTSKNNLHIVKQVIMKPTDTITFGDIIEWNDTFWICMLCDNTHEIYYTGDIRQCNNILKFYDENHNLYDDNYCVVSDSLLENEENKYMRLSHDQYVIYCQNNSDTANINENTRFILGSEAYRVIGVDSIVKVGLLEVRVLKDSVTVNDNMSLGIADYYSNQDTYEIAIKNSETASLLYTDSTLQIIVECKKNGTIISSPVVTYSTNNTYVATVDEDGLITCKGTGTAIITATYQGVTDSITIQGVMVVSNDYNVVVLPLDSTIVVGKSKTFTASILNNGIVDVSKTCVWTLVNSDGSSNTYATLSMSGLSCTVSAISKSTNVGKFVKLRSTFAEDVNVYEEREIKITGLL